MKLHWWIAGAVVVASGVLAMKHIAERKENIFHLIGNGENKNYAESPADIYESEFEGTEFLI